MPELPDVEVFKRYFDATSLHQQIETAETASRQVLKGISQSELKKSLRGRSFVSTHRHGKHLFAYLDNDLVTAFHFGMTGFLKYFKDLEKEPEHDRMMVTFSNGFHLVYDSKRKLGEIRLIKNLDAFIKQKRLGPDAMEVSFPEFRQPFSSSRASIKSALMNQQILAGIGNVYSDEILFQAGIYPKSKAGPLKEKTLKKVYETMEEVVDKAIQCRADPKKFPDDFLIPHRRDKGKCPKCEGTLERDKIAGRTAYFCPKCQRG